jgi:hypothetical protein
MLDAWRFPFDNTPMEPARLPDHTAICKACKRPVSWENLVRSEREIQPRVFERAYICPHCRAVLEFASWQTGVSRRD